MQLRRFTQLTNAFSLKLDNTTGLSTPPPNTWVWTGPVTVPATTITVPANRLRVSCDCTTTCTCTGDAMNRPISPMFNMPSTDGSGASVGGSDVRIAWPVPLGGGLLRMTGGTTGGGILAKVAQSGGHTYLGGGLLNSPAQLDGHVYVEVPPLVRTASCIGIASLIGRNESALAIEVSMARAWSNRTIVNRMAADRTLPNSTALAWAH